MKDEGNVHPVGREQGGHDSPATTRKQMPSDASDLEFSLTKSYQGGRPSSMTIHERQESVEENPNQGNQYTYIVYRGRDRIVVGFTTTYAIIPYHH